MAGEKRDETTVRNIGKTGRDWCGRLVRGKKFFKGSSKTDENEISTRDTANNSQPFVNGRV
jgi:hypothetical protein